MTLGINPADRTEAMEANAKRLSDYLGRKLGLTVKTFVGKDYASLVDALKNGKADLALLPPFSLVKAEDSGAHLLLKAVRKGQPVYYATILTREDSGIEKIEDLKGKSFSWVEKDSATGYLYPRAELARRHLDPETFLGKQSFLGTHDAVVMSVFKKEANAGATWVNDTEGKKGAWHLYLKKPEEQAAMKMIWVSDPIPGDALASSGHLWKSDRAVAEQVSRELQRMGEGLEGRQILRDLNGIDQLVPATPKDYDSVRSAARLVSGQAH